MIFFRTRLSKLLALLFDGVDVPFAVLLLLSSPLIAVRFRYVFLFVSLWRIPMRRFCRSVPMERLFYFCLSGFRCAWVQRNRQVCPQLPTSQGGVW